MTCWMCGGAKPGCKCDQLQADMDALVDGRPVGMLVNDIDNTPVYPSDEWMSTDSATAGRHGHLRGMVDRPPPDERPELMASDDWQRVAARIRSGPTYAEPPATDWVGTFAGLGVLAIDRHTTFGDETVEMEIAGVGVVHLPAGAMDLYESRPVRSETVRRGTITDAVLRSSSWPSTHQMGLSLVEPGPDSVRRRAAEEILRAAPGITAALARLGETVNRITPELVELAERMTQAALGPPPPHGIENEVMVIGGEYHGMTVSMPPNAHAVMVPMTVLRLDNAGLAAMVRAEAWPICTVGPDDNPRRFAVAPNWEVTEHSAITTVNTEQLERMDDVEGLPPLVRRQLTAAHATECAPLFIHGGYALTETVITARPEPECDWTVYGTYQVIAAPPA